MEYFQSTIYKQHVVLVIRLKFASLFLQVFKCLGIILQSELFFFSDHLWGRRLSEVSLSLIGEKPDSESLKMKKKKKKSCGGRGTWRTEIPADIMGKGKILNME